MDKFEKLTAIACPVPLAAIDTDQLIPARFMSRPRSAGYGEFLLYDRRVDAEGAPLGFVLDQPAYKGAKILVTGADFGVGSSREAAVYALWDYGIRCVIATSFADIFAANAVQNGFLTAQVAPEVVEALIAALQAAPGAMVTVDLEAQQLACGEISAGFLVDPVRRLQLLNGWDDLDLTKQHDEAIIAFRAQHQMLRPWAFTG